MTIPKDSVILLSYLNTKLRDTGRSFKDLCVELEIDSEKIEKQLETIDYHYDEKQNRFL